MKRKALSICVLICMLCMSMVQGVVFAAPAEEGFVFQEDFSSGTIGSFYCANTSNSKFVTETGVAGIDKYFKYYGTWGSLNAELKKTSSPAYDRSIQVGTANAFSTEGANTTVYIDADLMLNNAEYSTGTNFALYIGARADVNYSNVVASEVMGLWFDPATKRIKKSKGTAPFNMNSPGSNFEDFATPVSYVANHWYHLRVVVKVTDADSVVRTYDVYLDGKKIAEDLPFANDLADQLLTSVTLIRAAGAGTEGNFVGYTNVSVYVDKGNGALTDTGALIAKTREAQKYAATVDEESPAVHSAAANAVLKAEINNAITLYDSVKTLTATSAIETNIANEITALNTKIETVRNSTAESSDYVAPAYDRKISYFKLPLNYVNTVSANYPLSANFKFKTTSGTGTVDVCVANWDGSAFDTSDPTSFPPIGNSIDAVAITANGEYSVDIREKVVDAIDAGNDYLSLALVTTDEIAIMSTEQATDGKWSLSFDFEGETTGRWDKSTFYSWMPEGNISGEYVIAACGAANNNYQPRIANTDLENGGTYLFLPGGNGSGTLVHGKVFNSFKASALTDEDIGKIYDISFDAKIQGTVASRSDIDVGAMKYNNREFYQQGITSSNTSGTSGQTYASANAVGAYNYVDSSTWNTIKTSHMIDAGDVTYQTMLGFYIPQMTQTAPNEGLMIDNLVIQDITDAPKFEYTSPSNSESVAGLKRYHKADAEVTVVESGITTGEFATGETLTATPSVLSATDADVRGILAVYDSDGNLKRVSIGGLVHITAGNPSDVTVSMATLPTINTGDYFRVYVWSADFEEAITPYMVPVSFTKR